MNSKWLSLHSQCAFDSNNLEQTDYGRMTHFINKRNQKKYYSKLHIASFWKDHFGADENIFLEGWKKEFCMKNYSRKNKKTAKFCLQMQEPRNSSIKYGVLLNSLSVSDENDDPELSIIFDQVSQMKATGDCHKNDNRKVKEQFFYEVDIRSGRLNPANPEEYFRNFYSIHDQQDNECSNNEQHSATNTNDLLRSFHNPEASRFYLDCSTCTSTSLLIEKIICRNKHKRACPSTKDMMLNKGASMSAFKKLRPVCHRKKILQADTYSIH